MLVFIGPTGKGLDLTGVDIVPPAAQGDIASAVIDGERTIVLIDGYFTQHLAPWHKEILFAVQHGARVVGAGSLGAIRAVECERYGAEPVGVIADWYKYGTCIDDADVALVHSPGEDGYKPLSVPLVNIRSTALKLKEMGLVDSEEHIVREAASIYYVERSWNSLHKKLGSISAHLHEHYIDQKAIDAIEAIKYASEFCDQKGEQASNIVTHCMYSMLTNDINFNGKKLWANATHREEALNFWLISEMAVALGMKATAEEVFAESGKMWAQFGIKTPEDAQSWMDTHSVNESKWNTFASKKAIVQKAKNWFNSVSKGSQIVPITNEYQFFTAK
jgi:hypothetical protein